MTISGEQKQRLLGHLRKLAARDAGAPTPDISDMMSAGFLFNSQDQTDAVTLVNMGWIKSRHFGHNPANSWSSEGIYAFDLTDDGRAMLSEWEQAATAASEAQSNESETGIATGERPSVMMIHGSKGGVVPSIVDSIRLWCFERDLPAYKAADTPNAGRFVYQKVDDVIDTADYFIIVLTADEQLTSGEYRPRPNTMIEMGRVLARDPSKVCVLVENGVDLPSDYQGLLKESLSDWERVLERELRGAGLL